MARINGTSGNDSLWGDPDGRSNDVLNGYGGDDDLHGGDWNDTLFGGDGNDHLYGGKGVDQLYGGSGDDTFWVEFWADNYYDNYYGGSGYDIIAADRSSVDIVVGELNSIEEIYSPLAGGVSTARIIGNEGANTIDLRPIKVTGIYAVRGAGGDDVIYDNDTGRTVEGNAGNDTLYGMGGKDVLRGGTGNDLLDGGDGDDIFEVWKSEGMDTFVGGAGIDHIVAQENNVQIGIAGIQGVEEISGGTFTGVGITGDSGSNIIDLTGVTLTNITAIRGGDGFDDITGTSGVDNIYGDAGNDTIRHTGGDDSFDGGAGTDTAVFSGYRDDYVFNDVSVRSLATGEIIKISHIERLKFADQTVNLVALSNVAPSAPTDGSSSTNTISEGAATGSLVGVTARSTDSNSGDSVIYRLTDNAGGRFAINQTTGVVSVANGSLIDYEAAASHVIQVQAFDGLDYSATSTFTIQVTNVAPTAPRDGDGNAANNIISENVAAGTVVADLQIGASDPGGTPLTYVFTDASGKFEFDATSGLVRLKAGQSIDNEVNQSFTVSLVAKDGTATSSSSSFVISVANVVEDQVYTGTANADSFVAVSDDNWTAWGLAGNDVITTRAGADIIRGGLGNDTISAGAGNDLILVGAGEGGDWVDGGAGNDTLAATADDVVIGLSYFANVETVTAGGFNGVTLAGTAGSDNLDFSATTLVGITGPIDGGAGWDTIRGTDSGDRLIGNTGIDFLYGNAGDDQFLFGAGLTAADADYIYGGAGYDQLVANADNAVIAVQSLSEIEAISGGGYTNVSIQTGNSGVYFDFTSYTLTGIAEIKGGTGSDTITGTTGNDVINGGNGDDTLNGGAGDDILFGGFGGNSGNDVLNGGDGNDILLFQSQGQVDRMNGGAGYDIVQAAENNARLTLGTGNTLSSYLVGIEEINAGGFTGVVVEAQSQALSYGWNSQTLNLSAVKLVGDITIRGSYGSDTITGTNGDDRIDGWNGNDTIRGGSGKDMLWGAAGADIFDFDLLTDSTVTNPDLIMDFVSGTDKIDLSTLDANPISSGDQAFSFIGNKDFSGEIGQLRYDSTTAPGITSLYGDVDGDMIADFRIDIFGTVNLVSSDLLM